MLKTLTITALFMIAAVIEQVSSQTETCVGEFCFTTPESNELKNFAGAKSWCSAHNSTLAVVNDSDTQAALAQFLNSSKITAMAYINMKCQERDSTWFLVNGSKYRGQVNNQENETVTAEYKLYCHLAPNKISGSNDFEFLVRASNPSYLGQYICDFQGTSCPNNSMANIFFKERCYVNFDNESLTWFKARESCIKKGGDLAQFQYEFGNEWIPPFATSLLNPSLHYWVGLRWNDRRWKSPDDAKEESIYTSWSNGKPNSYNNSCVCVDPNGEPVWSWTDCNCTAERQFICLKIVPTTTVITTTPTTTTMTSTTTKTTTPTTTFTGPMKTSNLGREQIIGIGVGIGGGVLIIIIVVIIVITVVIKRRKRKCNGNNESRLGIENLSKNNDEVQPNKVAESDGKALYSQVHKPPRNQVNNSRGKDVYAQVNKHPQNQANNDVYAKVVSDGKQQINKIESSPEIIYSAPEFAQDQKSTPPSSNYEVAHRVHEPDMVPTLRGQTQSIFPIRYSNAYANEKEAE